MSGVLLDGVTKAFGPVAVVHDVTLDRRRRDRALLVPAAAEDNLAATRGRLERVDAAAS